MKVFVVHIYDNAGQLHNYYVHQTVEDATYKAAWDVVEGRFEALDPEDFAAEITRVAAAVYKEPKVGRCHVQCDAWRAQIDEMHVLSPEGLSSASTPSSADSALPTNLVCQGLIGTIGACGTDGHYCSDRCWMLGKLRSAQALVREYERRLGVQESR